MNTIFDYFTSKALAAYYNTKLADANTQPYLGDELFPAKKKKKKKNGIKFKIY